MSKNRFILSVLMIACLMIVSVPAILAADPTTPATPPTAQIPKEGPVLNTATDQMARTYATTGGVYYYNKKITGMFVSNPYDQNVWAHISGVGWRKINPTYASQVVNTATVLSDACANGKLVTLYVTNTSSDGLIQVAYLWG
jgi:hypothetical protein